MTPEVDELEDEFRRPRLAEVTGELLDATVGRGLISIEDVHWMDEASADVMSHLASRAEQSGWLICVSRRDDGTGWEPREPVVSIRPDRLSVEHAGQLIDSVTADRPLLPHARAALAGDRAATRCFSASWCGRQETTSMICRDRSKPWRWPRSTDFRPRIDGCFGWRACSA